MSAMDWLFKYICQIIISMKESFSKGLQVESKLIFISVPGLVFYLFLSTRTVFCLDVENCIGEADQTYENDIAGKKYPHSFNFVRIDDPSNTDRYRAEEGQLKMTKIDCIKLQCFIQISLY